MYGSSIEKTLIKPKILGILNRRYLGALTSKEYAFKGRPWELQNSMFFDIFDVNGTQLRADFREANILRILPKKIPNISVWITDRARFQYLAYNQFRLKQPNIFLNYNVYSITPFNLTNWFFYIQNKVTQIAASNLLTFANSTRKTGPDIGFDFSAGVSIGGKLLNKLKAFGGLIGQKIKKENKANDFVYYYDKTKLFIDTKKILIIGLDLRLWFPYLNYYFRQQTKKGNTIFSIGSRIYYNFQNQHLGSSVVDIKRHLGGQHWQNSNQDYKVFVNRKLLEIMTFNHNQPSSINKFETIKSQFYILTDKPTSLTFDNISFKSSTNLCLNRTHYKWVKKRQLFFSIIQPQEKAKTFLNIFFGIHSIQSFFMSGFSSIVNIQIPMDSPIENDEIFLVYDGKWITQTPTYRNKNKINILNSLEEVLWFWNEKFISPKIETTKEKVSNNYVRLFDTNKFFIDIPSQAAGILGALESIRKTKRTKYIKCSL